MNEQVMRFRFYKLDVPIQEDYREAESFFCNLSFAVDRKKTVNNFAVYQIEGVESNARHYLEHKGISHFWKY